MSVREALHQQIADLHGALLREISAFMCVHWQGLDQAAPAIRKRKITDGTQAKKLILLGGAYNLSTHITLISSNPFRMSISNDINIFAGTHQPDEVTQTDAARAPVAECTAPPPAATDAATTAPAPVTECVASVLFDFLAGEPPVPPGCGVSSGAAHRQNRCDSGFSVWSRYPNCWEFVTYSLSPCDYSLSPCDLCGDCGSDGGGVFSPCRICASDACRWLKRHLSSLLQRLS